MIRMDDFNFQKVFSIRFPGKQVYIECTFKTLKEKMEEIKKDKDHYFYEILKKYPNPEIREEGYRGSNREIKVARIYFKDCYKILNIKFLPI